MKVALGAAFLLLGIGCVRPADHAAQRVAVLRFENLSSDVSRDWMCRAASEVLAYELSASPRVYVIPSILLRTSSALRAPGISTQLSQALVDGASEIIYGYLSEAGGKLRLNVWLEDTAAQRTRRAAQATGSAAAGILPLAEAVARQLQSIVNRYSTHSEAALHALVNAVEADNAAAAQENLSRAIDADQNFGAAYLAWAQFALSRNDRGSAERVLAQAMSRANSFNELDRAQVELQIALLHNDRALRVRSLAALSRATPGDFTLLRSLGEAAGSQRDYTAAARYYERAVALQPNDPVLLNQLGYAKSWAGDLDGAVKTLRQYERLRPAEPNPLDSLGDVNFAYGRFAEAEKLYRQAQNKDPHFLAGGSLLKAAYARLMTGDLSSADLVFGQYARERQAAGDVLLEIRKADWEFFSGRRTAALNHLAAFARAAESSAARDLASRAYAQRVVWLLQLGDRTQARESAIKATATSASAGSAQFAALGRFLTEPAAPASEWQARAERAFTGPLQAGTKNLAMGYALLLNRDFQAAAGVLKQLADPSPEVQQSTAVLLAWALLESGATDGVAGLLKLNPLPDRFGLDSFASLWFPRLFYLRGVMLEKLSQRDEAKKNYRLFLTLSGPTPEIFGQEQRAAEALAR